MTQNIAILGWGSLLWEGGSAFDKTHAAWRCDGPILKIEFSRISQRRAGALTLVIDPANGVPTRVAWCLSLRDTVGEAVEDLRMREETSVQNIGVVVLGAHSRSADQDTVDEVTKWAGGRNLVGVIWTDLRGNFERRTGKRFSYDAALNYVAGLSGEARGRALEYIRRAPSFVRTPVRDALSNMPN